MNLGDNRHFYVWAHGNCVFGGGSEGQLPGGKGRTGDSGADSQEPTAGRGTRQNGIRVCHAKVQSSRRSYSIGVPVWQEGATQPGSPYMRGGSTSERGT